MDGWMDEQTDRRTHKLHTKQITPLPYTGMGGNFSNLEIKLVPVIFVIGLNQSVKSRPKYTTLMEVVFFCPYVYPQLIQLQSYKKQRTLYFKGYLGLQI